MERESGSADAVFDFFYIDRHRIDTYLAQFSDFGSLSKLVRSIKVSDEKHGDVDVKVVKGGAISRQETGLEKHFDAQFIAPLTFLDEINARNMLKLDADRARIGNIMLLSGTLNIVDVRTFQKVFETLSATPPATSADHRNRRERRTKPSEESFTPATGLRILAALDPPMIMLFETVDKKYWSTIDVTAIVGNSTDLHLKHGSTIAGEWQIVGILDCLPGTNSSAEELQICGDRENPFGASMSSMLRELKLVMGRPSDCYGITPLIIMREVS